MTIADLISVLSFGITVFALGYQIGYHHGKNDVNTEQKK
jgi:hypothetical protein